MFYVSRCYNLWSSSLGDSTTSIDLLHQEIVHRTRTLPFGCVVQAKVSKSRAHLAKYRGAKTVKAVYLSPVNARGGGIFAAPLGSTEIDVFPTGRIVEGACEVAIVEGLAIAKSLVLDDKDPERPILYEPEGVDDGNGPEDEVMEGGVGPLNEEDEEMIADDTYAPVSAPAEEGEARILPDEGENMEDMEIDWLANHLLEALYEGPDLRATSQEVADSFTLKFGGSRVKCQVPRNAVSETSGEQLDPSCASMKLELEELESFGVGKVISEDEARKSARESGRQVLTSRWVNTVKRQGLYRSRLVVRDYASMGGTTLSSLEGLRLLLALLCRRGSVLSCDVSVAFMHAAVSRPEYVEPHLEDEGLREAVPPKNWRTIDGANLLQNVGLPLCPNTSQAVVDQTWMARGAMVMRKLGCWVPFFGGQDHAQLGSLRSPPHHVLEESMVQSCQPLPRQSWWNRRADGGNPRHLWIRTRNRAPSLGIGRRGHLPIRLAEKDFPRRRRLPVAASPADTSSAGVADVGGAFSPG